MASQTKSKLTSSISSTLDPEGAWEALQETFLRANLPLALGILSLTFVYVSLSTLLLAPASIRWVLFLVSLSTTCLYCGLYVVLRRAAPGQARRAFPARVYPFALMLAGLALVNGLLHLSLTGNLSQTIYLIFMLIGAGVLFLSSKWLNVLVGLTCIGWLLATLPHRGQSNWGHFGLLLLFAAALAVLLHRNNKQTLQHYEIARMQNEHHQATLDKLTQTTEVNRLALETSNKVTQHLTSILDLHTLLNEVADLIKESGDYYFVGVFLPDTRNQYVVLRAGTGEAGQMLSESAFRLRLGYEGAVGWVAAYRRPLYIEDTREDPRYIEIEQLPRTRSELALPLVSGSKLLGVLDIHADRPNALNDDDMLILQTLAGQVAVAIQNASLYEIERYQRLLSDKLYNFGRALSRTLDLSEVLNLILKQLVDLVPYDRGAVLLPQNGELVFVEARGFPDEVNPLKLRVQIKENDVFQEIYNTRRPLLIPDVSRRSDWEYVEGLPPARVWLGVPLLRLDEVIGMLSLARESLEPYTESDIVLASAFAGQAAIALENARLYENVKLSNQKLQERSEALQTAYKQLERLDHTKSDFIKVAAHELRTPLTVMGGYSQMLQNDQGIHENEYYRQLVEGIRSGTRRLHEVINSMLDVAKIDSRAVQLYPESLSLVTILRLVVQGFEKVLPERNLTLKFKIAPNLPDIRADHVALRKVFSNLVENAIKYTPDGGHITIMAHSHEPDAEYPRGSVEVVVQDTGIGIDPRFHEQIFSKFYQTGKVALHSTGKTKFKGGGPGLGLAIVRGLVEAHKGKVWAESPGYDEETCPGSSFHVLLPIELPEREGQ